MANNNFDLSGNITDTQKQINQYKAAMDSLQTSINNLNKPFNDFSNNINVLAGDIEKLTSTINKLESQNQSLDKSGFKIKETIENLTNAFNIWEKVIAFVKAGVISLESALTGGLAILSVYGPEILKFTTSLFKGKEAIDQSKLSLDNLNKAIGSSEYSKAIKQFNELKINVDLANKGFLEKKDVLKQYNETIGKSIGYANTFAEAESKMVKNGPAYLKMTLYKTAAQSALQNAAKKAYEAELANLKPDDDALSFWDKVKTSFYVGSIEMEAYGDKKRKELAAKRRIEQSKDAKDESKGLFAIAEKFQKDALLIAKTYKIDFWGGEGRKNSTPKFTPKPSPALQPTRGTEALTAQSVTIAKTFELQKQQYDADAALLKQQLGQKLISQEAYNQQSSQLQEKYHQDTGDRIKAFAADEMAGTLKNIREAANTEAQRQQAITEVAMQYEQQRRDFTLQTTQQVADSAFSIISSNISAQSDAHLRGLEGQKANELNNTSLTAIQRKAIEDKYKKKEAEEKVKAFKAEQRASVLQAVVNGALAITKATAQTGVFAAFVIPGIIASTALQVATIIAQKPPAFARGGRFTSDGRGALLPGYSRTDDTNARLRSGEAIVVSEAMRNPWARNLVSAINVAHGGRDFSAPATGRGYAIGGIFTDGGNANRYYNQPVNDARDLANTMAYQLINNFPPIYVDVKDVNNQQHILAQTVNRVNL